MNYKEIIFEKEKPLATITLNRPEKLNAYTHKMGQEIVKALGEAAKDRNIRAVIITGAGRGFCSGVDVGGRGGPQEAAPIRRDTAMGPPVRRLSQFDKPVIAAINGVVAGGGLSFAMACDIRIASDRARFSQIFVKRGIVPDNGSTWFLPRLVGMAKACELAWTGDIIDAAEGERIGLVSRVVPHDDLLTVVRELATRIANGPPITVQLTKRALYQGAISTDLHAQMELELHYNATTMATEDRKEGTRAFIEKREPVFKGR
ncbi:MAG: enoyl-CoA hydratase [Chloroflexi bacterium]|nr:enoyl-CoA hydratase [Chloroflexota bacterium]